MCCRKHIKYYVYSTCMYLIKAVYITCIQNIICLPSSLWLLVFQFLVPAHNVVFSLS